MRWIAAIGGGAFVVASLIVGVRLLWLARRTRGTPEILLGSALLLMGGIGYPAIAVARSAAAMPVEARELLAALSHSMMVLGVTAMSVFNWKVFHPESAGSRTACLAFTAGLVACWVWQAIDPGFRASALEQRGSGMVGINALSALAMAWAAAESLQYWRMMRRRLALGLADPQIVTRFRDWGIASTAASVIAAGAMGLRAAGLDPAASPAAALLIGPLGVLAAIQLARAFRPKRNGAAARTIA